MDANPFLGVILHAIGGLAAASFYIPYKRTNMLHRPPARGVTS